MAVRKDGSAREGCVDEAWGRWRAKVEGCREGCERTEAKRRRKPEQQDNVASKWGLTALADSSGRQRCDNANETSPAVEGTCCDPSVHTPSPARHARLVPCLHTVHPVCPAHPLLALANLAAHRRNVPRHRDVPAWASVAAFCYACPMRAAVDPRRKGRDCRGASTKSGVGRRGRQGIAANRARVPSAARETATYPSRVPSTYPAVPLTHGDASYRAPPSSLPAPPSCAPSLPVAPPSPPPSAP